MVRPREFDRDAALDRAMQVFWAKGFAATSTEDLVAAMGIGRQSLYNAFGDKRRLYLESLEAYQQLDGSADHVGGALLASRAARHLACLHPHPSDLDCRYTFSKALWMPF